MVNKDVLHAVVENPSTCLSENYIDKGGFESFFYRFESTQDYFVLNEHGFGTAGVNFLQGKGLTQDLIEKLIKTLKLASTVNVQISAKSLCVNAINVVMAFNKAGYNLTKNETDYSNVHVNLTFTKDTIVLNGNYNVQVNGFSVSNGRITYN